MKVYLSHPIDGAGVRSELGGLVSHAQRELWADQIGWIDPQTEYAEQIKAAGAAGAARLVWRLTYKGLAGADAMLVVWPAELPSVGVPIELAWADASEIPVALCGGPGYSLMLEGFVVEGQGRVRRFGCTPDGVREAVQWLSRSYG